MALPILVALVVLGYSFQSLFTRLFSIHYAGEDNSRASSVFSIGFGLLIGVASLIVGGFSFAPSWQTVGFGVLNAAMLLLFNRSMMEAGNRGSYSFLMIASMFGGLIPPILMNVLILDVPLTAVRWVGIVLMLCVMALMNIRGLSLKGSTRAYFFWCALLFLSNGIFACGLTLQQIVMQATERTEMLTIMYLGSSLAMLITQLVQRGPRFKNDLCMGKKALLMLVICGLATTMGANLLLYGVNLMDSSVLYTIDNGGVLVLSVLYARFLFKEKLRPEQLVAIVLAVISIILLSI